MERIYIIKEKLANIGEDYDDLKPFMQEHLNKVEEFISNREKIKNEAIELIKNASYNISDVSKELGCSRTTLYNHNQLLKRYIEASVAISNKNNPYILCEYLKESREKLQEQVSLMENRDIDIEIQKHEKIVLTNKVLEQSKEIERLQSRVNELSSELHQLKSIPDKYEKVIDIK